MELYKKIITMATNDKQYDIINLILNRYDNIENNISEYYSDDDFSIYTWLKKMDIEDLTSEIKNIIKIDNVSLFSKIRKTIVKMKNNIIIDYIIEYNAQCILEYLLRNGELDISYNDYIIFRDICCYDNTINILEMICETTTIPENIIRIGMCNAIKYSCDYNIQLIYSKYTDKVINNEVYREAVIYMNETLIQKYLNKNKDFIKYDNYFSLQYSVIQNNTNLVKLFLEFAKNNNIYVDVDISNGYMLETATNNMNNEIIRLLLDNGARYDIKGHKLMNECIKTKNYEIIKYLLINYYKE